MNPNFLFNVITILLYFCSYQLLGRKDSRSGRGGSGGVDESSSFFFPKHLKVERHFSEKQQETNMISMIVRIKTNEATLPKKDF